MKTTPSIILTLFVGMLTSCAISSDFSKQKYLNLKHQKNTFASTTMQATYLTLDQTKVMSHYEVIDTIKPSIDSVMTGVENSKSHSAYAEQKSGIKIITVNFEQKPQAVDSANVIFHPPSPEKHTIKDKTTKANRNSGPLTSGSQATSMLVDFLLNVAITAAVFIMVLAGIVLYLAIFPAW